MILSQDMKKRYEAFWSADAYERCTLYLTAPRENRLPVPAPRDLAQAWEDVEYRLEATTAAMANTHYLGDAFPSVFANYGPGCLAAVVGGSHKWAKGTVWFENEPVVTDWNAPPELRIDRESEMYRLVERFTARFMEAGRGRFYTSLTDIGGTYDIIASLRGTENLLTDLVDYPDQVKAFADRLFPLWKEYFLYNARMLLEGQGAITSWMPIYSERIYSPLQCDFCAMISPDMFEAFILPDLRKQVEMLDRSIYHWDGPGELPHLDHLLSIERLNAVQWTPGDGAPDTTDECWYEYYDRIQRAGKSLILLSADPDGMENLLRHVSTKGLYVCCHAGDLNQARELLTFAERLGVK